jgi:hypothetical protein
MTTFVSFADWNLSKSSCICVEVYGIVTERWSWPAGIVTAVVMAGRYCDRVAVMAGRYCDRAVVTAGWYCDRVVVTAGRYCDREVVMAGHNCNWCV